VNGTKHWARLLDQGEKFVKDSVHFGSFDIERR